MFVHACFRTRNIHTSFSAVYLCWSHHQRALFSTLVTLVRLSVGAFFRSGNIHTFHLPVYLCICVGPLSVWAFRYVCGRLFSNEEHSHTSFACLFVLDSSLAGMVTLGYFTAVTVRHGSRQLGASSWIVIIRLVFQG